MREDQPKTKRLFSPLNTIVDQYKARMPLSRKKFEHFELGKSIRLVLKQERAKTIEYETSIERKIITR